MPTSSFASSAGDLPDVNVWLALSAPTHLHHAPARAYWKEDSESQLWFCRQSALGLKRLLAQPSVMGTQAQSTAQCWASWQTWLQLPEIGVLAEPGEIDAVLARLSREISWPAKLWPDAYLAAFAMAANLRLVSFDSGFARFPGLNWLHLRPTSPLLMNSL